jgi:hypothetical protein
MDVQHVTPIRPYFQDRLQYTINNGVRSEDWFVWAVVSDFWNFNNGAWKLGFGAISGQHERIASALQGLNLTLYYCGHPTGFKMVVEKNDLHDCLSHYRLFSFVCQLMPKRTDLLLSKIWLRKKDASSYLDASVGNKPHIIIRSQVYRTGRKPPAAQQIFKFAGGGFRMKVNIQMVCRQIGQHKNCLVRTHAFQPKNTIIEQ